MELESIGNIKMIRLGARLDAVTGGALNEMISELINDGSENILIDMGDLQFISSYGLGVLASSSKRIRGRGGRLKLARMSDEVKVPFEITGTLPHFEVFDNCEKAIKSFDA